MFKTSYEHVVRRQSTLESETNGGNSIAQVVPFGCHISLMNFISGGLFGKSSGKVKIAVNKPPS